MKIPFAKRFASSAVTAVFTVTTVVAVMPPPIHAADEESCLYTDDGFAYIVNEEGTITLKGRDPEREDEYDHTRLVLPSTIDGKYVTEIDTEYFKNKGYDDKQSVTEIVLPDHIEKISSWCFSDYKSLDTLVIPATLKDVVRPFNYCKIQKVILEDGMETVPNELFRLTDYIGELVIPDSVKAVGERAFSECSGLKEVHVPDSVKRIGDYAFSGDPDLEVLDLPDVLEYIGLWAFANNPKITSVYIPDTWTFADGAYGFFESTGIREITFGPERTEIPSRICMSCESLETINWSNSPVKIGSSAFYNCISLRDPKLPDSIEIIEANAFGDCTGIEKLDLPANLKELSNQSFGNTTSLKYLYVPMQLPASGAYGESAAFRNSGIEKLVFADGITEVNGMTASGLPNLTEIVIPDSVTSISDHAFAGDVSLANIRLPEGLEHISWFNTFSDCQSLKTLTVPPHTEGDRAFSSAPALETIYISEGMTEIPEGLFRSCENLKRVVIPESVTKIKSWAFDHCTALETVEMKQENVEIENAAFSYCNSLWDDRFSLARKGDLFISKSSPAQTEGGITNYTIYYAINPNFTEYFETAHLDVTVEPWNYLVINESLPEGFTAGRAGFSIDLGSSSGIFRFSVRNPENDVVKVTAELSARLHENPANERDTRQISVTDTEFNPLTLSVPDEVSISGGKASFYAYGYAPIGEEVTLTVNGEEYGKAASNKYTGKYSLQVDCTDVDGIITVQAVCGDIKSGVKEITADADKPVLVDFDVSHDNSHEYWHKDMTDMFRTGYSPYVAYNPDRPLEFDVQLDNDDNVGTTYVFSDTHGEISFVPLEKNKETGRWEGSGFFDTTLPGDMYIGQTPKTEKGTAVEKKNEDGSTSLEYNGKDLLNITPKNVDPVKELIENSEIKVEENTDSRTAVKLKMNIPPGVIHDRGPYEEPSEELDINIFQELTDNIFIDGDDLPSDKAAESPEEHGFAESGIKVIDDNGDTHTYYVRYLTDESSVRELTERKSMSNGSVYDFLKSDDAGTPSGMVVLDVNETKKETSYVTEFFNETKDLQKDTLTGIDVSLATELLAGGAKTAAQSATVVMSAVQNGIDLYGSYQGYSDTLEQIDFSKNEYVRTHSNELKAQAKGIYYTRVLVAVGAVVVGGVATFAASIPCAVGIAIAGAVTFGSWMINKLLDKAENKLKSKVYVTAKGEMNEGIDPSGYVYAAVPDNRVEGAVATIYYKDENGNAVKWNAEDYDQINPVITDSAGWFMWDVPEGAWQVKVEAEGYEEYTTEWLPVLPVQTDVNIPLKSIVPAKLALIDACSNAVEVKLSQYIDDRTATAESIYLTDSKGELIKCKIKPIKSETNDTGYSDSILLISDSENISGSTLHITSGLLSYSGIASEPAEEKINEVKQVFLIDDDNDYELGDVNEDGKIDAKDASMILVYYSKMSTGGEGDLSKAQMKAANVNGDALIDAKDASFILAYYSLASTASGDIPTMAEFMASR